MTSATSNLNAYLEPKPSRLGVHKLTEFVYCARAGILAHAQQFPNEEELEEPSTSFTPDWDRYRIEAALSEALRRLRRQALIIAALLLAGLASWALGHGLGMVVSILITFVLGDRACATWEDVEILRERLFLAESAVPAEPDPSSPTRQRVDWWSLLRAGFESERCLSRLSHPELGLEGSPWRILRKGSLRIPVFVLRRYDPDKPFVVFHQHVVRMAAYCELVSSNFAADSPYGIVIWSGYYAGLALPFNDASRQALREALGNAHAAIHEASDGRDPAPPLIRLCVACPWGEPRFVFDGPRRDGLPLPILPRLSRDGRAYHSACGDRFSWIPPHASATAQDLH